LESWKVGKLESWRVGKLESWEVGEKVTGIRWQEAEGQSSQLQGVPASQPGRKLHHRTPVFPITVRLRPLRELERRWQV
jgi:hypothetical protein